MRKSFTISLVLFHSLATLAQTSSITRSDLHQVHLTGEAGAYHAPEEGNDTANLVFITYSLPGNMKSVAQAYLQQPLGSVQSALAKANNGHLTVDVTCVDFSLLTVRGSAGKVTTMGTGHQCVVNGVH